ncbi:polysaccharide deacetylase family protein [Catalinimonas alkaloidigena]|nr:polysaccharide deacetylase family protein [Catalinimonas alkaloidigena]
MFPSFTWHMPTQQTELFLTFDDGPIPGVTDFVLEQLDQHDAKGTFFCVGDNVRKYPDEFRRVLQKGHAVGNHTFHHLNGWRTDDEHYLDNIRRCDEVMQAVGGDDFEHRPLGRRLFRPPYGRVTRDQIRMVRPQYRVIMWDVLTADYDASLGQERCLQKALQYSRPGSIVIFHDSHKAEKNLRYVLPRLLDHFSEKGFQFKTL